MGEKQKATVAELMCDNADKEAIKVIESIQDGERVEILKEDKEAINLAKLYLNVRNTFCEIKMISSLSIHKKYFGVYNINFNDLNSFHKILINVKP